MTDPIRGYNGNIRLKGEGSKVEFTPHEIAEFIKCADDIEYFAENYIKVITVDKGFVPIKLFDYQREIIRAFNDNRYVVVNTARQMGKSVTAVIIILHYILFNKHKLVAILSNKAKGAMEVLYKIKTAYEALPKWLQQGIVEWNKGTIILENGSKVIAEATTGNSARGLAVNIAYIDEAAFIENWDEFFTSVYPTISSGDTTKLLLTSTPKGLNHFFQVVEGAKAGTNGYVYVEAPWWRHPKRNEAWKEATLKGLNFDQQKFEQDFCCSFIGSTSSLIPGSTLKLIISDITDPIHSANGLSVYKDPVVGKTYTMVVDVSRGKGLDYSAFHVFDISSMPYEQVCVYRNNTITPVDYAEVVQKIAKIYNEAYVLVETNDIGGQVVDTLHFDFELDNIFYTETAGRAGKRISSGFGQGADRGVRTTTPVKATGCSILKLLLEQRQLMIYDFETVQELSTFVRKGKSYEAEPGKHDDLVMGLVLFAWLSTQAMFKNLTDINTLMQLREKTESEILDDVMPFFTWDPGSNQIITTTVSPKDDDNWLN
jgi:hypothetical protein